MWKRGGTDRRVKERGEGEGLESQLGSNQSRKGQTYHIRFKVASVAALFSGISHLQ